jgi:esterase
MHLHYTKLGLKGDDIIILHGLFGSGDNWQSIAKALSNRFQVYLIDLRNHGKSFHSDDMNFELMAEDVVELLTSLHLENVVLIGHSLGGKIAITLARDTPARVQKLIVVDIGIKASEGRHANFVKAMMQVDFSNTTNRSDIKLQLKTSIPENNIRSFLMKNCVRGDNNSFGWRLNLNAIHTNYRALMDEITLLHKVSVETHFIRGLESDYILDDDIPKLKERFRKVSFHNIPNAGHWPHADRPKYLLEILNTILPSPTF